MDDEDLPANSSLPLPPPFYKSFTKENIAELETIYNSKLSSTSDANLSARQLLTPADIPSHLLHLVPPPPPPDGKYTIFSVPTMYPPAKPSLPPETPKLYSTPSPSALLTLSRSAFLNYIELIDILVRNPDPGIWGPKWDYLRDLLRNCHDICNEYQAWALKRQVRVYMEGVLAKTEREGTEFEKLKKRMEGLEGEIREAREARQGEKERKGEGLVNGEGGEDVVNGQESAEEMEVDEIWADLDAD